MVVEKRFAPSFLISCNLVQFRVFFRASFFLVVQGFCLHCHVLPGCTRKIDICLRTRLFKMDAEQNRFLLRSIFVCFFLGFVIRAGCTRLPPVCHKDSLLRFDFAGGKILGL